MSFLPGVYVDPADEYEQVAEFVAQFYGNPLCLGLMQALLAVPQHILDDIAANPQDWERRVKEYCYGLVMSEKETS